jgi:hypothetical protein
MVWSDSCAGNVSVNLASDSLLSADTKTGMISWPHAAKIHRLHPTNEYLGYCGDSFVALSAISSAIATISNSDHLQKVSEAEAPTSTARVKALHEHLKSTYLLLPDEWRQHTILVLASYDGRKKCPSVWVLELTETDVLEPQEIDVSAGNVRCFGSGASNAESRIASLKTVDPITTKDIVSVLVDVIRDDSETTVGGSPQMVTITEGTHLPIGFWWPDKNGKSERHLFGLPIQFSSKMESVKWMTPEFQEKPFVPFKRID